MNEGDVAVWPDGTWCYKEDLEEMLTFMSDDYYITQPCDMEDQQWQ